MERQPSRRYGAFAQQIVTLKDFQYNDTIFLGLFFKDEVFCEHLS